ncbi:MAG TPA: hypothetical protein VFT43_13950 [Candidatus Polarisedimenticolia bacterium]|nr:hypothetical protein [Candidatus Polarisedimenticolia bacterium]
MPDSEPAVTAAATRHSLADRILADSSPESLRLAAARGALPLPLQELLFVQVRLLADAAQAVAQAAAESLVAVPLETLVPIFADPGCDPVVIDHFARSGRMDGAALEAVIAHPAIPDATLETLAAEAPTETLNLIVTNEVRIIGNPRLLSLLRSNPNLHPDNRRRLLELERDFVGKETLQVRRAPAAAAGPATEALPTPGDAPPPDVVPDEAAAEAETPPPLSPEEEQKYEEELRRTPAFQRIMKLNVAERVQLAMKGNAEERAILIRDTARLVAQQVLKSPKLSDSEITSFANMRNVSEDILRVIASHRDWTKTYTVAHALVRNPKTPTGVSVQFLPRLGTRDLKIVMGDKNIPELLRRQARNLFVARTQPPKKMGKKAH